MFQMDFKRLKEKVFASISGFVDRTKKDAKTLIYSPILLELLIILISILFPKFYSLKAILLMVLVFLIGALVFSLYIPTIPIKERKGMFGSLIIEFFFLSLYILGISGVVLGRIYKMSSFGLFMIGTLMSGLLTLLFSKNKKTEEIKENLKKRKTIEEYLGVSSINDGDIVLCKDKEIAEKNMGDSRVIIPYRDRFLHMLILGATGTGKTSQVILPMLNQDIQNKEVGVIVMEPKGDLAQQAKFLSDHYGRPCLYFDPSMDDCPHFNPLSGREIDVVEDMAITFRMLMPDSSTFYLDLSEQLVRYSIKTLKRLDRAEGIEGKYANLIQLSHLIQNTGGQGRNIIAKLQRVNAPTEQEHSENNEICSWFLTEYLSDRSKVFENTSGIRSQVSKICSNEFLREVLNPDVSKGEKNDIDFDKALEEGWIICISTAQGVLRNLSKYIGYFLILQLQSAVFRRPGDENTRRPCFLYIDEFQSYSTPGFSDMLTQGRSYRVASILATQARSQMKMGGGKDGEAFVNLVSTNARNVVLFPGLSEEDATYYSRQFGEYEKTELSVSKTRKVFSPMSGGMSLPGHGSEAVREQTKKEANVSATDIIYRPFGEITYSIIQNNTLQNARFGLVNFIDSEIKKEIDEKVRKYLKEHAKKTSEEILEEKKEEIENEIVWED